MKTIMIKSNDQSERKLGQKQVRMGSCLLKLLSRDMKTKAKTKINKQVIIENSRKKKMAKNIREI